ncbi:MAG: InlB B-repeat-containing protein [bacterium JZ-2024 1]
MRFFRIFGLREVVVVSLGQVAFVSFVGLLFSLTACGGGGGAPPSLTFTLTVNKSGTGTGTVTSNPSGISCGNTCSALFSSGSTVTLFITPDTGSSFTGWSGNCTGNYPQFKVTMNGNKTCTATFNLIKTWAKTYGWADSDGASSIQQTSDGGYIVAGDTDSFGAGYSDIWVLKLDANGNIHGCTPANLVGTSYATPADSSASPQNTSATPSFSSATTNNTNAAINNTNGSTKVQCTG